MEYQETLLIDKLENTFWWHQHLFDKVYKEISKHFPHNTFTRILDCGCGTGGMMAYLKLKGYQNLSGFDNSPTAVEICKRKGLNVIHGNLEDLEKIFSDIEFDVIIALDSLYFLDDGKKLSFMQQIRKKASQKGIMIINLPAFSILRGNHDRIAQIPYRFTKHIFQNKFSISNDNIIRKTYWPFMLSPIILIVRLIQKLQLKLNPNMEVKSDVSATPPLINSIFKLLCNFENYILKTTFFGSSLFAVIRLKK